MTALAVEAAAVILVLGETVVHRVPGDPNTYRLGYLSSSDPERPHHVVLAVMPQDNTRNAAVVSTNLRRSFPSVRVIIMVGVAGGIPSLAHPDWHVRLGDVVVATDGVIDLGHIRQEDGRAAIRRPVGNVSADLLQAARTLELEELLGKRPWQATLDVRGRPELRAFARPPDQTDVLVVRRQPVRHPPRQLTGHVRGLPKIHRGAIGSSDMLLRDERRRDKLAREYGIVAVEMEGSGIAASAWQNGIDWFMVRGIVDYCEHSTKNDRWHGYASLAAVAYTCAVLAQCVPRTHADAGSVVHSDPVQQPDAVRLADPVRPAEVLEDPFEAPAEPEPLPQPAPRRGRSRRDVLGVHESGDDLYEIDIDPNVLGRLPARNGLFTGRGTLLDQLHRQLHRRQVAAVLPEALHGEGGVGKSQIAIEYAYRHRTDYELIWWVPAEHPAQILTAMGELADFLGLQVGPEMSSKVPAVKQSLQAGVPYANWLIIFDNAETLDSVRPYLPTSGRGKVLITARNPAWREVAHTLTVDLFARAESIQLLQVRNPEITTEEADQLAAALGDLPLAIEQAGAWHASTRMPVAEYVELLNVKRAELAAQGPDGSGQVPVAVAAAWNIALDRLGRENLAALQLLQVCSFFAPEPISQDLFAGPRIVPIAAELDEALRDPVKLNRAVRDIQKYALASIDHRESTLQMHRLVKEVLIDRMSPEQRVQMEHGAHTLLAGGNPGEPANSSQWRRFQTLLPHVTASRTIECDDPWARQLVLDMVRYLYYWGDWAQCRDLAQQMVDRWRNHVEDGDPQALQAGKWLGYVRRLLGEYREAAVLNEEILRRYESVAGSNDEGTLDALTMVAGDHRVSGQFNRARTVSQQILLRARQAFGSDDPATLAAAHSLGVTFRLTGEFRAAWRLDLDTYRRRVLVLGSDHHLTLLTLNGLTLDQREAGAYAEACDLQERLYERRQSSVGIDHPAAVECALNLAVALRRAGLAERARKLSEDAMSRYERRFGPYHPNTIAAAFNVAIDRRDAGELDSALALAAEVVQRYSGTLGEGHPYSLIARTNLAAILRLTGDPGAALAADRTALTDLEDELGYDHVFTLASAVGLASDYFALSDPATASTYDEQALQRYTRVLGGGHPATLGCTVNWAADLRALGRSDEAEQLHADALAGYEQALGQHHPAWQAAAEWQRVSIDVDPMPF